MSEACPGQASDVSPDTPAGAGGWAQPPAPTLPRRPALPADAAALAERVEALEGLLADVLDSLERLPERLSGAVVSPMLSADDLAARLSVSRRTVDALDAAGDLPPAVRIGRQRRWDRGAVETWIRTGGAS